MLLLLHQSCGIDLCLSFPFALLFHTRHVAHARVDCRSFLCFRCSAPSSLVFSLAILHTFKKGKRLQQATHSFDFSGSRWVTQALFSQTLVCCVFCLKSFLVRVLSLFSCTLTESEASDFLDFQFDQLADVEFINDLYYDLLENENRGGASKDKKKAHGADEVISEEEICSRAERESHDDRLTSGLLSEGAEASIQEVSSQPIVVDLFLPVLTSQSQRLSRLSRELFAAVSKEKYSHKKLTEKRAFIMSKVHLAFKREQERLEVRGLFLLLFLRLSLHFHEILLATAYLESKTPS